MDLNLDGRIGGKKGAKNGEETAKIFTGFKEYYLRKKDALAFNGVKTTNGMIKTLKERDANEYHHFSDAMIDYLIAGIFPQGVVPEESLIPWVKLHPLGFDPMYLPGTISGLTEEVQPTWETYKYIGSPFNSYKYNGVERTMQFNINLYWKEQTQIYRIKQQLEYIKQLCFPAPDITIAKYKNSPTGSLGASDQLFYRPQFLELTIHGYARKVFGFIESLSINIPDDATWPSTNNNAEYSDSSKPPGKMTKDLWGKFLTNTIFPSNVEVSIGFKIIENPHAQLSQDGTKVKYNYNLDGLGGTNVDNYKYPTRPSVVFVPQEDITKKDEIPVISTSTTPPAPTKVTTITPKVTTPTVITSTVVAGAETDAPWSMKKSGLTPAQLYKRNTFANWTQRYSLTKKQIEEMAAKQKLNEGLGGN
jgi:hypothetical protein